MLFNSFVFIFVFMPIVFAGYFWLQACRLPRIAKAFLVVASLIFYSYWNVDYLPLIIMSILTNYALGKIIFHHRKKFWLVLGLIFNIGLLVYYKYIDFLIMNLNAFLKGNLDLIHVMLPLAISFFTFQQIAYLVDSYRGETKSYGLLNYFLFISFFPQLIAGPIVRHQEVMGQFNDPSKRALNIDNIAAGIFLFSIGLFKKVALADNFSLIANEGFNHAEGLTFIDSWITSLAYTFQLYFDFSGYTDMALGLALCFNIRLPTNFNSPYKALNIQDFWRRWHITLGNFLTNYLYIPLGGNRQGSARTYLNIFIIFFISGIWHGAGWTFVIWGMLHGIASIIYRYWSTFHIRLHRALAWFLTFMFINATWVIFRASSLSNAWQVWKAMLGLNGVEIPRNLLPQQLEAMMEFLTVSLVDQLPVGYSGESIVWIFGGFLLVLLFKNSIQQFENMTFRARSALFASMLFIYSVLNLANVQEFIYFNF